MSSSKLFKVITYLDGAKINDQIVSADSNWEAEHDAVLPTITVESAEFTYDDYVAFYKNKGVQNEKAR
jgi:hypothetical protein